MSQIIQCFNFEYTYKNNFDQIITIVYELKDISYEINEIIKDDIINAQQCRDRETDLMQKFLFDMTFKIIYYPKDGGQPKIKYIHSKNKFKFEIPILSLTYNDIIRNMTDLERWRNGIDINLVGGDLILAGVKYILPNLWSFPFNKPIVVVADKNQQVVRAEYLRQTNPIFGNSYYIAYHIVVDKNSNPDIVVYLKQNHDQRFNKDNKKTTPVYIPILLLFYVYGIENDEQFLKICNKNNNVSYGLFLLNAIRYGQYHKRLQQMYPDFREKAKHYLAQYILLPDYYDHITTILEKYVHPINNKFFIVLQDVIYKMYKVYKDSTVQFDKDSLQNKRVKTVAEQVVEQLRSRMAENYKQEMHNLEQDKFKITPFEEMETLQSTLENSAQNYSTKITKTMKRSFTSPNSSIQSSCLRKVQNEYKTINYDLIQKREIVIRAEGKGKITWHQRKVQNSFFGFIDPVQTPEAGENVGRYLSPTIYAQITCGQDPSIVQDYLNSNDLFIKDVCIQDIIQGRLKNKFPVKINYITYGFVDSNNLFKLYYDILNWKCSQQDRMFISVYYSIEHQELIILTDIGRIMIPLLHGIETFEELNNTPIDTLVNEKKIIFVCSEMIQNFLVKTTPDISIPFDKYEREQLFKKKIYNKNAYYFLPYETLSPITATNPFINHMKSVRASYSCPQQKQGVGCPNTNYMNNMPNDQLILHKLQRSPIKTAIGETVYKHIPLGNLVNLAIMEYCFNQEDAIVACRGYFQRGGLQVSEYHTNQIVLSSNKNIFAINNAVYEKNKESYHLLNQTMFIPDHIGETVNQGDVLIASIIASQQLPIPRIHNNTFQNDVNAKYVMVSNFNSLFDNLQKTYKMTRIQIARQTNIGDKFISRNAQKGTIGKILHEWELPIDEHGISPNFITSSQSILKRETYGQLLEIVLNKKLCFEKQYRIQLGLDERYIQQQDANITKESDNINELTNEFTNKLSNELTNESYLISSLSEIQATTLISDKGIPIKNKITTGPIIYMPYTHLVENKIRARNDGAIDQITKQPVSGKKHDGGLKMGTLDVSSLFTQGICNTMRHQFGQNSSNCQWYYCKNCHYMTIYKHRINNTHYCQHCQQLVSPNTIGYGSFNYGLKFYNDVMYSLGFQLQIFDENEKDYSDSDLIDQNDIHNEGMITSNELSQNNDEITQHETSQHEISLHESFQHESSQHETSQHNTQQECSDDICHSSNEECSGSDSSFI